MIRKSNEKNNLQEISEPLLEWYKKNKRDLPWRKTKNPYYIWISEIMLQQTRVEAVKGYYSRFLERLPDVAALAFVSEDELMKLWQGLGYYNRARNMKKAAILIMERYNGAFPESYENLLLLPGIGEYTAGAIASIAYELPVPAIDGNVYRIYTRLCADNSEIQKTSTKRRIYQEMKEIIPEKKASCFNQALMDLGATICIPNGLPLCEQCPLKKFCKASAQNRTLDFPVKPKKAARKLEDKTIFVIEYEGRYLLQKRPDKGLLAGLWEFPTQEGKMGMDAIQKMLKKNKIDYTEIELLGTNKHIFSHIEWRMLGYLLHVKKMPEEWKQQFVFVSKQQIKQEFSIPSAYAFYLKKIIE